MTEADKLAGELATHVMKISQEVQALLHGHGMMIQGAVLADLLSLWLAGQLVPGDEEATKQVREAALQQHMNVVRDMIPSSEREILERMHPEGSA